MSMIPYNPCIQLSLLNGKRNYVLKSQIHYGRQVLVSFFKLIFDILQIKLDPDPLNVILGVSDNVPKLPKAHQCFLSYGLIIARKLLLMHWKKTESPVQKCGLPIL